MYEYLNCSIYQFKHPTVSKKNANMEFLAVQVQHKLQITMKKLISGICHTWPVMAFCKVNTVFLRIFFFEFRNCRKFKFKSGNYLRKYGMSGINAKPPRFSLIYSKDPPKFWVCFYEENIKWTCSNCFHFFDKNWSTFGWLD